VNLEGVKAIQYDYGTRMALVKSTFPKSVVVILRTKVTGGEVIFRAGLICWKWNGRIEPGLACFLAFVTTGNSGVGNLDFCVWR